MKAVLAKAAGGPEVLSFEEVPDPKPGPGQVLVRVGAIGVNFSDVLVRQGFYKPPAHPYIPGWELAGTIETVGTDVTAWSGGEEVVTLAGSAYAEKVVADAKSVFRVPRGFSMEESAAFPAAFNTAFHALRSAGRLAPGECVLVHAAAGGVGSAAVQLAKAFGARVLGTAGSAPKIEFLRELGCEVCINYREEDFVERARRETGGRGVDLVLDSIGGETFTRSLAALAPFGRVVVFGSASGKSGQVETGSLLADCRSVTGMNMSRWSAIAEIHAGAQREIGALLASREVRPIVGKILRLAEAAEAHRLLEKGETIGKTILVP